MAGISQTTRSNVFSSKFNENIWIWIQVSLKFVPTSPINNIPALDMSLDQIMAWCRPGDKPLSEPKVQCWLEYRRISASLGLNELN